MWFLRRHPNFAMLAAGLLVSCLLVVAAEFLLRLRPKSDDLTPYTVFSPRTAYEEPIGYRPAADCMVVGESKNIRETFYHYEANIDEYHRRITNCPGAPSKGQFVLFFGCSFTFGDGLRDDQTLPSRFCVRVPGIEVQNYAFPGYGVQQMYCLLSRPRKMPKEMRAPTGLALYVYIDDHLQRLRGTVSWASATPHLEIEDGRVVYKGSFAPHTPLEKVRAWVDGTRLGRLAHRTLRPIGPPSPEDRDKLARVCAESKEKMQDMFPGSDLKVVIFPMVQTASIIKNLLDEYGVDCLDYHDLLDSSGMTMEQIFLPDGHPRPKIVQIIADRLAKDLAADPVWGPRLGIVP